VNLALAAGAVLAAVPSPSPTSTVPDELEVTPGLTGFLATFAVAAAAVLLFLSLTRHLRTARSNAIARGLPVDEPRRHRFGEEGVSGVQSPDVGPADGLDVDEPRDADERPEGDERPDDGRGPGR
jgi:hypothetical protein